VAIVLGGSCPRWLLSGYREFYMVSETTVASAKNHVGQRWAKPTVD